MLVTLVMFALGTRDAAITLKRVAKPETTYAYNEVQIQKFRGQTVRYDGTLVETIRSVEPNGNIAIQTIRHGSTDADGMIPPETTVRVYNPLGEVVRHETIMSDLERINDLRRLALVSLRYPKGEVKPGDRWTLDWKSKFEDHSFGCKATFTFDAIESVGTIESAKVRLASTERDAGSGSASVTFWVDLRDGSIVKAQGQITNLPYIDANIGATLEFTIARA